MTENHYTVADCFRCPICDENEMDKLTWDSKGELVTCATCGTTYEPGEWGS